MSTITAALVCNDEASCRLVAALANHSLISDLLLINTSPNDSTLRIEERQRAKFIEGDFFSGATVARVLDEAKSDYILFIFPDEEIELGARAIDRMLQRAVECGAALVYSDYKDDIDGALTVHPLIDYQLDSIRVTFDFV